MWALRWLYKLPLRIRSLFQRNRVEQELAEEMQFHLEQKIGQLVASGLSPEDARYAAMRDMDGLEQQKESCRDTRGVTLIEDLIQDVRYALRTFRRTPILVLVIVVSLALGIGANAAIFSVVNAVLLRTLPVQQPERLLLLEWFSLDESDKYIENIHGHDSNAKGLYHSTSMPLATYQSLKAENHVFSDTFAFAANDSRANVGLSGHAESGLLQSVSGNYFQALGVQSALGRAIFPSDDTDSAAPVAVASYQFFRSKLGGDLSLIGKPLTINGVPVTLVGVAPPEFFGLEPGTLPDLWIPLSLYIQLSQRDEVDLHQPKTWWVSVGGRLAPGVTTEQASSELRVLFRQSMESISPVAPDDKSVPELGVLPLSKGLDFLREQFSTSLRLLMAMVGVVLLVACANVAGLLLTRARARQREIAIRVSLGAARSRIIRQLLTESVLLAFLGGLAGLLVTKWTSDALVSLLSAGRQSVYLPVSIDLRVLAFTAALSILCGILFGLAPALTSTRTNILPLVHRAPSKWTGRRWLTAGRTLVSGQVALCVLLLICAGLLLGTLRKLQNGNLGFAKENLLTFNVRPGLNGYQGPRLATYYDELQRRAEHIPGVRSATFSMNGPIGSGSWNRLGWAPGYSTPESPVKVFFHSVGPHYFETLHIPVLAGRTITSQDTATSPHVALVNEAAVKNVFHGDNPIGQRMHFGLHGNDTELEIVGVVGDAKYGDVRSEPPPTVYTSYLQRKNINSAMCYQVRTTGDPATVITAIRREVLSLDPAVPAVGMQTEEEVVQQTLFLERTFAALSSTFAALAMLLSCIGLYGTISYSVAQRTSEIGIRMALGAARERILLMVLRETSMIVITGIVAGTLFAAVTTRLLRSQLYGLSPVDPLIIGLAACICVAATLLAGIVPARRASRVDPIVALRCE